MTESNTELCLRDDSGMITAWIAGYSTEELNELLLRHPDWYRSTCPHA